MVRKSAIVETDAQILHSRWQLRDGSAVVGSWRRQKDPFCIETTFTVVSISTFFSFYSDLIKNIKKLAEKSHRFSC